MAKRPPARRRARLARRTTARGPEATPPVHPVAHRLRACGARQSAAKSKARASRPAVAKRRPAGTRDEAVKKAAARAKCDRPGTPFPRVPAARSSSRRHRRHSISKRQPSAARSRAGRDGAHPGRAHRVESGPDGRRCRRRLGRRLQLGRRSARR